MASDSRQLAAIMFTDIAGYTKLMGQDEQKALQLIRQNRELQQPIIAKHNGTWIKEMGDGTIAKFNTAFDAVNCAMDIQDAAKSSLPQKLRIGIHLGDIILENDDVFGDGVNIASRIESIAEPDSVFISEAVYSAIKGNTDYKGQFQGAKRLKNVDDPIKVYKVVTDDVFQAVKPNGFKKIAPVAVIVVLLVMAGLWRFTGVFNSGQEKSIIVLPLILVNMDSTKLQLAQGITEQLIRNLGNLKALSVINPKSSQVFQSSFTPVNDAVKRLHETDFFLLGKLKLKDNFIEIDLGLYDRKEVRIWQKVYKDDMVKLPELTGRIALEVAKAIRVKIKSVEENRLLELKPIDPELYSLWIKGLNQINVWRPSSFIKARMYLNEGVDKYPADSRAWAMLAEGLVTMGHSTMPPEGAWQEAKAAALRALQLDSLNAEAWAALAHTKTYFEWDYEGAEIAYHKANTLNPSNAMNHYHYAWHLFLFDRLDEAIIEHKKAQKLDPLRPGHSAWLGLFYIQKGDYEQAKLSAGRALAINKKFPPAHFILGQIHFKQARYDSAIYEYKQAYEIAMEAVANFKKGDIQRGREILNKIKSWKMNSMNAFNLCTIYAEIDSIDQFFEYANYNPPLWASPWLRKIVSNPKVIGDPRYRDLMNKMNLPMPEGYENTLIEKDDISSS